MEATFKSNLDFKTIDPEVRSYIYQVLLDFEPFTSSATVIAVSAKDPSALNIEGMSQSELERQFRISISLTEDGTQIEEEGLAKDIYGALREAKDKLMRHLTEIQDSVVTPAERASQIQWALSKPQVH